MRRIRNEFRQAAFQDMEAVDFGQVAAVARFDQVFETRSIDIAEDGFAIDELGHIGNRHAQMLANSVQCRVDRLPGVFFTSIQWR